MRTWIRNSYGSITDGIGWEIYRDSDDSLIEDFGNVGKPWSLWHHGEYVNNYPTVEAAKADADPVDCSKCADLLPSNPQEGSDHE